MTTALNVVEKDGIQTVSARELHKGLAISKRFSEWFSTNSKDFVENEDFTSVLIGTEVQNNGGVQIRNLQDYAISIDMAKSICLMSRTEIGKKYRQYLIKLEAMWNTPEMVMKRALEFANKKVAEQQALIEEQAPKVVVYDNLVDRSKLMNFRDFAPKIGMTQKQFMNLLKTKYVYKNSVGEYRAYAEYNHLFDLRTFSRGVDKTGEQLMLNMEGIKYFLNMFNAETIADKWLESEEVV